MKRVAGIVVVMGLFAVPAIVVNAVTAQRLDSARRGAQWIVDNLQPDGSFPQIGGSVSADTGDALAAVVAGGISGAPIAPLLGYLSSNAQAETGQGAHTGRVIAGIVAGGGDPRNFGGFDFVAKLTSQYDAVNGVYDSSNFLADLQGANGALAANGSLPPQAASYIRANECPSAPFGFAFDGAACAFGADVDTTALAVNVLVAAGLLSDPAVARSRSYLFSQENGTDGGFGFGGVASSVSTGLALTMISALGEEAQSPPWRQSPTVDPVQALLALQDPPGSFDAGCGPCSVPFATVNAVPGMAGKSYPIRPAATGPSPSPSPSPSTSPSPSPGPGGGEGGSAPNTTISSADLRTTRDRTPTFQFAANAVNVRFECSTDGADFIPCSSPYTLRKLKRGEHTFSVEAIDASGLADPSPATDGFRVVKQRRRR